MSSVLGLAVSLVEGGRPITSRRRKMLRPMMCGAALLLQTAPPQAAPWRCAPLRMDDAWMLTSLRDDGDSPLLLDFRALQLPFAPPLWPGELRTFVPSPREYQPAQYSGSPGPRPRPACRGCGPESSWLRSSPQNQPSVAGRSCRRIVPRLAPWYCPHEQKKTCLVTQKCRCAPAAPGWPRFLLKHHPL